MNITIEHPSVTASPKGPRNVVPRKRIRIVLLGALIALGAVAAVNLDAADSPSSPTAPIAADPRAELQVQPMEIVGGCLNDTECSGQWP